MIIRNEKEREEAGLVTLGYVCGNCNEALSDHYPVILVGDRNRTGYHLHCAALLVAQITDELSDYLGEISQQARQHDMEEAFRRAAHMEVRGDQGRK